MMVRELGVITEGFKRLRGSWTDTGRKTQLKHTFQRKNETPKASHTNRLVSKPPCSTVVDTVNLDICVKAFIYRSIHRFIYM